MRTKLEQEISDKFDQWLRETLEEYNGPFNNAVADNYFMEPDWEELLREYINEDPKIGLHVAYEAGFRQALRYIAFMMPSFDKIVQSIVEPEPNNVFK